MAELSTILVLFSLKGPIPVVFLRSLFLRADTAHQDNVMTPIPPQEQHWVLRYLIYPVYHEVFHLNWHHLL